MRALLLGGLPLGERIVMWWNFIGRTHEEIVEFRRQWMTGIGMTGIGLAEIDAREPDPTPRQGETLFGPVAGYPGRPLPAPEMPGLRLNPAPDSLAKPRDSPHWEPRTESLDLGAPPVTSELAAQAAAPFSRCSTTGSGPVCSTPSCWVALVSAT